MATERFISLDAVIKKLKDELQNCKPIEFCDDYITEYKKRVIPKLLRDVINYLENQPSVDAVEVVYCDECKYRVLDTVNGEDWCNHTLGLCSEVYATDFCCHGERKDNDN